MKFSYAVKASILFWLSSCVVMFVLFGSLSSVLLSAFTWNGSSYHCKAPHGEKFVLQGAKMPVETFWGIIVTGSVSSLVALTLLGTFMVLLILMVYKMTSFNNNTPEKGELEKQIKQLEECCTPDETEKLIPVEDCREQQQQQQQPPAPVPTPVLSDWSQLSVCLVLECICFLMVFCFFVSWMFVSRDVAFFPSTLSQKFHTTRVPLTCEAPLMWTALDIMCFLGVCSWFVLGVWILGSFLLINKWSHSSAAKSSSSSSSRPCY